MNLPNVKHPLKINYNGWIFQVVSVDQLTDQQALAIVEHHMRTNRMLKKDRGSVIITIRCTIDAATIQRMLDGSL